MNGSFYVVSYDIQDDRRRNRVCKTLKNFGGRVQYSVFECELDRRQFLRLKHQLEKEIDNQTDSLVFYPLCQVCLKKTERSGQIRKGFDKDDLIV